MRDPISVGLGERVVSRDPQDILVAYGLGSCLGIGMIDPVARVCGLLHAAAGPRRCQKDSFSTAQSMGAQSANPIRYQHHS